MHQQRIGIHLDFIIRAIFIGIHFKDKYQKSNLYTSSNWIWQMHNNWNNPDKDYLKPPEWHSLKLMNFISDPRFQNALKTYLREYTFCVHILCTRCTLNLTCGKLSKTGIPNILLWTKTKAFWQGLLLLINLVKKLLLLFRYPAPQCVEQPPVGLSKDISKIH